MEIIGTFLPILLIVLAAVAWGLGIAALIHIIKHPNYRVGSRTFWILFVLIFQVIGPICYFIFGRDKEKY